MNESKIHPWYAHPKPIENKKPSVIIVGGGIAGISCAYELTQHGINSTIIDRNPIASQASGNPFGLVRPHLTADNNTFDQLLTPGAMLTLKTIQHLKNKGHHIDGQNHGVLQLLASERLENRYQKIMQNRQLDNDFAEHIDAQVASQLAGITLKHNALHLKAAAMVSPTQLCQALLAECGKDTQYIQETVNAIRYDNDQWQVTTDKQTLKADVIILACAHQSTQFEISKDLSLKTVPGQLSYLEKHAELDKLKLPLCFEGYCLPTNDGAILGATFRDDDNLEVTDNDHQLNLETFAKALPELAKKLTCRDGRVSIRCITPDRLPLIGPISEKDNIETRYQRVALGDYRDAPAAEYWSNAFVSVGHGSKGLSSALIAAKIICSYLLGQPFPVDQSVLNAVHPSRFWMRALSKQNQALNNE